MLIALTSVLLFPSCLVTARLATALPISVAASRRAWVANRPPCRHRAARARCPFNRQRPRASRCLLAAPGPQPPPAPRPRGCHAGCLREPLRAALLRPSFRRSSAVLAQHTTAVKQSAPPRGRTAAAPQGGPRRAPQPRRRTLLYRALYAVARSRRASRPANQEQTKPDRRGPAEPPAPLKCVGVPPSKGWSGGAPCATSRAAFARQNRAARSAATSRLATCLPRSARWQSRSSAPRAVTPAASTFAHAAVAPAPKKRALARCVRKLRAARHEREPRQRADRWPAARCHASRCIPPSRQ